MKMKIKNILKFILLFFSSYLFSYVLALLLNIDLTKLSESMLVLYSFISNIGFMGIIFYIYRKKLIEDMRDYTDNFKKYIRLSLKFYTIGLAIMVISNLIIDTFFINATANNEESIRLLIDKYPLYMFFSVSIYAPFVEEIIYRKSIRDVCYDYQNKYTKYIYVIISGLIFALLHVIDGASNYQDYLYIIPYLSLGICFATLYDKTDNIFTTIVIHSFHNILTLIIYLLGGLF